MISGALLLPVRDTTGQFLKNASPASCSPSCCGLRFTLFFRGAMKRSRGTAFTPSSPLTGHAGPGNHGNEPAADSTEIQRGHSSLVPLRADGPLPLPASHIPWVEKAGKAAFAYFLLLWALTLLFPYLQTIFPSYLGKCPWNEYGALHSFSGYLGYMVLGCFLRKYPGNASFARTVSLGRSVSGRGLLVYPPFLPDVHGSGLVLKRRLHRLRQH